jgi:transposase
MNKQLQSPTALLRYCVGIDVSKDTLQLCVAVIDTQGKSTVKGSSKVNNRLSAFKNLISWVDKHCKVKNLPVRYIMESTAQAALRSVS